MKTKTRNYSVCALMAAVLLAMAMLVTGCMAEPSTETGYKPPAGMGAVRLSFNKAIQRTILPDDANINSFEKFGVEFLAVGGSAITVPEEFYDLEDFETEVFELDAPGSYTMTVIGYLKSNDPDDPTSPAAIATESLTIAVDGVYPQEIILRAISTPDATEKGRFSWTITNSIDPGKTINSAEMTIAPISDPDNPVETITLEPEDTDWSSTDPVVLDAGFYFVVIYLDVEGYTPVSFRHVLHIYLNQESYFEYVFTDAYFPTIEIIGNATANITDIDYEHPEDIEFLFSVGSADYEEGDTVTVTLGATVTITVTNASAFADDSIEWYCNGETSTGASFVFDTTEASFKEVKLYHLSVIAEGDEDGLIYGSSLLINVVDGP